MPQEQLPDGGENRKARPGHHPLTRLIEVHVPPWENEQSAPPVDEQKLRELWRNELGAEPRLLIWKNVLRFRSWAEALCRVIVEDEHSKKDRD